MELHFYKILPCWSKDVKKRLHFNQCSRVYFDHKLADVVSVPGIYMQNLIQGCEQDKYNPGSPTCPPRPYKKLEILL